MYQRIGNTAFKKDLTNITKLCKALGNPQDNFKSIHVAGTNGKGSTCHILSAIYQKNGYKVGLYTSPHLVDFRERIKINGELCSEKFVIDFTNQIKDLIEEIEPSFFEITVAMAFSYFSLKQVDVAIIETGLGGRLDSTNIIQPISCIITSIGLDHMDMLGDTIEKIASEKAGIIKPNIPVVLGKLSTDASRVITQIANQNDSEVCHFKDESFSTDLAGIHQQWNIGAAIKCVELNEDILPTHKKHTNKALISVGETSSFLGRWQTLNQSPKVICDVGHNVQGFKLIAEQLLNEKKDIHYIFGFVKDKDQNKIIPLLPNGITYHFVKPEIIRGKDSGEVKREFEKFGISGTAHGSLETAFKTVWPLLRTNDTSLLFVGGSNFIVADLLLLQQHDKLPF